MKRVAQRLVGPHRNFDRAGEAKKPSGGPTEKKERVNRLPDGAA